jgi:hypothetical protein
MKLRRARATEQEDLPIEEDVARSRNDLGDTHRETAGSLALQDTVDPNDPVFKLAPAKRWTWRKRRISERHDELLYGKWPRR